MGDIAAFQRMIKRTFKPEDKKNTVVVNYKCRAELHPRSGRLTCGNDVAMLKDFSKQLPVLCSSGGKAYYENSRMAVINLAKATQYYNDGCQVMLYQGNLLKKTVTRLFEIVAPEKPAPENTNVVRTRYALVALRNIFIATPRDFRPELVSQKQLDRISRLSESPVSLNEIRDRCQEVLALLLSK